MTTPLLSVSDLEMHFPVKASGGLFPRTEVVKAVDGVSFDLQAGECLGLVGESGCGKSTLGRCLMRLLTPTGGTVTLAGQDLTQLRGEALRRTRPQFQMIFQDPYASLNPRQTVFEIIAEPLKAHGLARGREELGRQVQELMGKVGLASRFAHKYPHEFSGGQRQRIAIARALALRPKVMICDEPVSALDVSIQAQILNLLDELKRDTGMAYVFIAHDLSAVRHIADRIAVMYLGRIVEIARTDELFQSPRHPYTQALLSAVPTPDPRVERTRQRIVLSGELPSPRHPPSGCSFHTRCPVAGPRCSQTRPEALTLTATHAASCLRL